VRRPAPASRITWLNINLDDCRAMLFDAGGRSMSPNADRPA
jgi:hypothetical protein